MKSNGVHHITTSPYHPSLRGLAERAIQMFMSGMKKLTEGTSETRVTRFPFHYCTTPHATTGQSPAELMLRRQLRTCLTFSRESEHTRSSRREPTMLTCSQGSSSLGHRSMPRTLAKGVAPWDHPIVQGSSVLHCRAGRWSCLSPTHGLLENSNSHSTTIS